MGVILDQVSISHDMCYVRHYLCQAQEEVSSSLEISLS
uniref:Uncharacterized protein n=1 Tax=Arundo donax TaxID=35708 RepID=A0A0A9EBR0_ARUDO